MSESQEKTITYRFQQGSEVDVSHVVVMRLNEDFVAEHTAPHPEWTKLDYNRCEGCAWNKTDRCPVAVRLQEPVMLLNKIFSHEEMRVTVTSEDRTYSKETSAQEALSSLFGLVMARSGCPAFEMFRGMAWFHLPFSNHEETLFRLFSVFLMKKLHNSGHTGIAESEMLAEIQRSYEQVAVVNRAIIGRIRIGAVPECDTPYNAITNLDSLGAVVAMSMSAGFAKMKAQLGLG